jgi:hypothetical protein
MRDKTMRSMKFVRHVPAALALAWALVPASAGATGIVLTGGTLTLDLADPAIGGNSTTLDRMDSLTWSGGSGAIAGQNLVATSGPGSCNGDPAEFFGQSYGEPEGTNPLIVWAGSTATSSNQTTTSVTSTTTGVVTCSCGNSTPGNTPATTTYNVFPAGDPNVNEIRISRTFEFSSATPLYNGTHGVRGYVARLPIGTYGTVLYPNAAGTAINTASAAACQNDCEESDWNGQWFADDNGSGTGMVVFRDPSSTSPALLAVNYDGLSQSNLTSIVLIQPRRRLEGAGDGNGVVVLLRSHDVDRGTAPGGYVADGLRTTRSCERTSRVLYCLHSGSERHARHGRHEQYRPNDGYQRRHSNQY